MFCCSRRPRSRLGPFIWFIPDLIQASILNWILGFVSVRLYVSTITPWRIWVFCRAMISGSTTLVRKLSRNLDPCMFLLCSIYVSTLLDPYFDCAWPMLWLCSTYVLTEVDLCFNFLDRNWVCFECAWSKSHFVDHNWIRFDYARPMSRLSIKIGYVSTLCST